MKKVVKWVLIVLAAGALAYGGYMLLMMAIPVIVSGIAAVVFLAALAIGILLAGKLIDMLPDRQPRRAGKVRAKKPRRTSFRHRVAMDASDTIMGGLSGVFYPKGPSPEELKREQERKQAKQDYAFHSSQAKKYAGTRDGAWHVDMAKRAKWKMK